jgi:hypothetical protein
MSGTRAAYHRNHDDGAGAHPLTENIQGERAR